MAGIFPLSFVARFAFLMHYRGTPLFEMPIIDARMYDSQARLIASGQWLGGDKIFYQAPFYSYFLALLYRFFDYSYSAVRLVQVLIGSGSAVLVYLLGRRIFDRPTGIVAGLTASVYGLFVFYEVQLLRTGLIIFLNLLTLSAIVTAAEKKSLGWWGCAGILLWLYLSSGEKPLNWRIHVAPALVLTLSTVAVIAPVTLRNYAVDGDAVMISAQGGLNFYIGNNPEADRTTFLQPGDEWDEMVAMAGKEGGAATASGNSRWFYRKTFSLIAEDPASWLVVMAKKAVSFWNGYEVTPNNDIDYFRERSSLLRLLIWRSGPLMVPFGLIALSPSPASPSAGDGVTKHSSYCLCLCPSSGEHGLLRSSLICPPAAPSDAGPHLYQRNPA